MSIVIRAASIADCAGIAKVHVDAWRESYTSIMPQEVLDRRNYAEREKVWRSIIERAEPSGFHFVASIGSEIIGFVSGGNNRSTTFNFKSEIFAIYLLQRYQKQGIGAQLFITALDHFVLAGHNDMMLWVLEENATRGFYERMGGAVVGTKTESFGGKDLVEVAYGWADLQVTLKVLNHKSI